MTSLGPKRGHGRGGRLQTPSASLNIIVVSSYRRLEVVPGTNQMQTAFSLSADASAGQEAEHMKNTAKAQWAVARCVGQQSTRP